MSLPKHRHICLAEDDPDDYYLYSGVIEEISDSNKLTWFKTCEDLLEYLKNGNYSIEEFLKIVQDIVNV
jgi:hypothetical protein